MGIVNKLIGLFSTNYEDYRASESKDENESASILSEKNTFYGATSISFRRNIIGRGLNIQSRTGITNFDEEFTKIIKKWSKKSANGKSNCEITGRYFFEEAQRQMADEYAAKSGGFMIGHHFSKDFTYGYKFELISLSKIDTYLHNPTQNIYNGIKIDNNGQIVGIYILEDTSSSKLISSENITLVTNKFVDIHQYSGKTPFIRIKEALEYIDNYKAKEMAGAGRRADTPIIIKTPRFKDIFNFIIKKEKKKGKNIDEAKLLSDFWGFGRLDKKKDFSKFDYIHSDEDVVETGKGVMTIYNDMWTNEAKGASAGVGLSAYSTAGIMPSSYNQALRAAQDEEALAEIYGQEIIEGGLREVIEHHLLLGCITVGKIDAQDYWEDPGKYRNCKFIREKKGHIDPVKTAKANTEDIIVNKTKTYQEALAEKGVDWKDFLQEQEQYEIEVLNMKKRVKDKYKEAGIDYESNNAMSTINKGDFTDEA